MRAVSWESVMIAGALRCSTYPIAVTDAAYIGLLFYVMSASSSSALALIQSSRSTACWFEPAIWIDAFVLSPFSGDPGTRSLKLATPVKRPRGETRNRRSVA